MDLGVGSFVFSNGVVSARAALKEVYASQQALARGSKFQSTSAGKRLATTLRASLPLFVLGFIRLATVKGTDYAVSLLYLLGYDSSLC